MGDGGPSGQFPQRRVLNAYDVIYVLCDMKGIKGFSLSPIESEAHGVRKDILYPITLCLSRYLHEQGGGGC